MEDVMEALPTNTPVHCADVIEMVNEYRVYVVNGDIRAICQYRGTTPPVSASTTPSTTTATAAAPVLDMKVVHEAVRLLSNCDEGRDVITGCSLDFAVTKAKKATPTEADSYFTCLVEVNDGYSLGRYAGLSGKDYTDLLIARWQRLMAAPPTTGTATIHTTTIGIPK
jgi:hypothetical protein